MDTFALLPITVDHPSELVTAETAKALSVGTTGGEVLRDGEWLKVGLKITDAAAVKAIQDGKRGLSVGYLTELDWTPGNTPDGAAYDARQVGIAANHIAICAAGRAGHLARIGEVVVALDGAFKKIADFSINIGQLREEARLKGIENAKISAQKIVEAACFTAASTEKSASNSADALLSDAKAQSKTIIAAAEKRASTINADAACIRDQAREAKVQADETLIAAETEATRLVRQEVRNRRLEPQARGWAAFASLLKEGAKAVFGETGYQRLADWVKPRWTTHPDNPERPVERQAGWTASRGPAP